MGGKSLLLLLLVLFLITRGWRRFTLVKSCVNDTRLLQHNHMHLYILDWPVRTQTNTILVYLNLICQLITHKNNISTQGGLSLRLEASFRWLSGVAGLKRHPHKYSIHCIRLFQSEPPQVFCCSMRCIHNL